MPASDTRRCLGIDFGTSGVRGIVIDGSTSIVAEARVPLPPSARHGTRSEQRPEHWWQALLDLLARLSARGALAGLDALCVDGTSTSVLPIDTAGRPLGPALMYDDSRAQREALSIAAHAPRDCAARGPGASLAKLLHLRQRYPRLHRVLHQSDWITGRLLGRYDVGDENNALKMGYDAERRAWPDWLHGLGLGADDLPSIYPAGTPLGNPDPSVAVQLGLPPGLQVVAGTTDSTAGFVATGASGAGDGVTSLGSTLVTKILSDRPVVDNRYGVYSHRLGDRWLVGGASNSGGAALLAYFSGDEIAAYSATLDPEHPTGLDYYPLPSPGERFPVPDPDLAPRVTPVPRDRGVYFQGMLEGIAAIEARAYTLLEDLGAPPLRRLYTVGGGSRNPGWQRIRARLLAVDMPAPAHDEAAYGAARLALGGLIH